MERAELLLPAGNIEKMEYAIAYGADAVYLGTADFSLRSPKAGNIITNENIKNSIKRAHEMGAMAYVTLNVFANNEIMCNISGLMDILKDEKPDGIIFADPGFYRIVKKELPDVPLHISTQANILNYETVKFWQDLGATRVILARELSLKEIEQIKNKVPDMELEVLVHGSMCVAYSGRCLLSDYLTKNERKANQGNCAQPCRWKYKIIEQRRPDEEYEINEDSHGTYIMNPKDLALIEHIPALINAGVDSFKIEGRTKSVYYVSQVAKTYRRAIDAHYAGININPEELYEELLNAGNRGFTTGFVVDKPDYTHYDYALNKSNAKSVFLGMISEKISNNRYKIKAKNQIKKTDIIECMTPNNQFSSKINKIIDVYGEEIEVANTNAEVILEFEHEKILEDWKWGIIRRKDNNNGTKTETNLHCRACD